VSPVCAAWTPQAHRCIAAVWENAPYLTDTRHHEAGLGTREGPGRRRDGENEPYLTDTRHHEAGPTTREGPGRNRGVDNPHSRDGADAN